MVSQQHPLKAYILENRWITYPIGQFLDNLVHVILQASILCLESRMLTLQLHVASILEARYS